jgi:hypothetical protein
MTDVSEPSLISPPEGRTATAEPEMSDATEQITRPSRRHRITERQNWRVVDGPVGRGSCLSSELDPDEAVFVAPPGVPLQVPEPSDGFAYWRTGVVREGRLVGNPTIHTIDEAVRQAPAHRAWFDAQVREREQRDSVFDASKRAAQRQGAVVGHAVPVIVVDGRPLPAVTHSASRFAEIVSELPGDSLISRLEALLANAISASHLAEDFRLLEFSIGSPGARELLVSLVHARARSHSWRYTRTLALFERRGAGQRELAALIDGAPDAQVVLRRLEVLDGLDDELDEALIDLLYTRSRSLRWRATTPLRSVLASPRFARTRRRLRGAQRTYAALKRGISESQVRAQLGR